MAENLVLLCRFHHGRLHTPGWSITKTGPGKALIVHHDGHETEPGQTGSDMGCGCADYRTAEDLDLDFQGDAANVFPTGLYPEEWSEHLKDDLGQAAEAIEHARIETELKQARARVRARFTAPDSGPATEHRTTPEPAAATATATATERGTGPEAENDSTPELGERTDQAGPEPELASLPALPRPQRDRR